ncbi:MAG TPA: hypothetical protein VNO21_27505, partial [Polyangiaceae bacterium]|nr:hypothetical protein [Polyangiaceae bacterium]
MRSRRFFSFACIGLALAVWSLPSAASASEGQGATPAIWLVVAAMLVAAKLGGQLAVWIDQPPVLGELFAGIVLGNLGLVGIHVFEHAAASDSIGFLAELG